MDRILVITYQPANQPMFMGPALDSRMFPGHAIDACVHDIISIQTQDFLMIDAPTSDVSTVPSPSALAIFGMGFVILARRCRRR